METGSSSNSQNEDSRDLDKGCGHYSRRCKIRAICCNQIFYCRHCHDNEKNQIHNTNDRHDIRPNEVEKVICSECKTEQDVAQYCVRCRVCMGRYFCSQCKLFEDDLSRQLYHCNGCGICRVGGSCNYFHCDKCGCCYSRQLESHTCVERLLDHRCPICCKDLFDSIDDITLLPCSHSMHLDCLQKLWKNPFMDEDKRNLCPVCKRNYI